MRTMVPWLWAALAVAPAPGFAQDVRYRMEPMKDAAPSELAAPIRAELGAGYRILTADGQPFVEIWIRKAIPVSKAPGAAEGALQFPFLAQGDLLGAVRYVGEGRDFRDQTLVKGVYTLRYGLQPVNGDHLGVSPVRDFGLLLPAEQDKALAAPVGDALFETSAQASGTEHPAILMMLATKGAAAALRHQEEKKWWSLLVPFSIKVEGKDAAQLVPIEVVVDGIAEA